MSTTNDRVQDQVLDLLINAAQAGSGAAFEKLYGLYAGLVFRTTFSILRNQGDAEDATQETFLRAYRGLKSFRREAQLHSWITRIAINSSLMILRKRRRRCELSIHGSSDTEENFLPMEFVDARPGPEELYGRKEAHSILVRSIERLPATFRSVVEERLFRERSTAGAAEALGISLAATKSRLLRAKNRLGKDYPRGPLDRVVLLDEKTPVVRV
jgi:RNA polymerase sigma-70 factor (ECF subfamily)